MPENKEDISHKLYSNDVVYRPPLEAESILLEVAVGCSYSGCTFCQEEVLRRYHVNDPADIMEKIKLLSSLAENKQRNSLFILGENALGLPYDFLEPIFTAIHIHLPQVKRISMYGRCRDILQKTKNELAQLRDIGLSDLYVGVESGNEEVLRHCRKGINTENMLRAFAVLDEVKISYGLSSILGLGGKALCIAHAHDTAAFYNKIHPKSIRVMTLTPVPGSTLAQEIAKGDFIELKPGEILLEERMLLADLEVDHCLFIGNHVSNNVPLVGFLQKDKENLLDTLDYAITEGQLDSWQKKQVQQW